MSTCTSTGNKEGAHRDASGESSKFQEANSNNPAKRASAKGMDGGTTSVSSDPVPTRCVRRSAFRRSVYRIPPEGGTRNSESPVEVSLELGAWRLVFRTFMQAPPPSIVHDW